MLVPTHHQMATSYLWPAQKLRHLHQNRTVSLTLPSLLDSLRMRSLISFYQVLQVIICILHSAFLPLFVELISLRNTLALYVLVCWNLILDILGFPTVPGTYWGPSHSIIIGMGKRMQNHWLPREWEWYRIYWENTITNWETRKINLHLLSYKI